LRDELGIDPAGMAGKLTEGLTQFLVPGVGAAMAVSKFSKLGKLARGTKNLKPDPGSLKTLKTTKQPFPAQELTTSQKAGLAAQQIGAAGLADAVVATDGTQTIGDFFEGGTFFSATATTPTLGLEGRERAMASLYNKSMFFFEGAGLAGLLPPIIGQGINYSAKLGAATSREVGLAAPGSVIGAGVEIAEQVADPNVDLVDVFSDQERLLKVGESGLKGAAIGAGLGVGSRAMQSVSKNLTEAIGKQEARYLKGEIGDTGIINTLDKAVAKALTAFRYRSFLPYDVGRMKSLVNPAIEGDIKKAEKALKNVDKEIKNVLRSKKFQDYRRLPDFSKEKLINNFMDVLEGAKSTDLEIPLDLFNVYSKAKNIIDDLSDNVLKSGAFKSLPEVRTGSMPRDLMTQNEFKQQVIKNITEGGYLTRNYQIFNDDNFKLAPDIRAGLIEKIKDGKAVDIKHVQKMLKDEPGNFPINDDFVAQFREGRRTNNPNRIKLTEAQAEKYIDLVTNHYKTLKHSKGGHTYGARSIPIVRLNPAVLNKAKVDNQIIREILGEVRNPKEAFIHTVGELSNFLAADTFYSFFRKYADDYTKNLGPNEKSLFVNTNEEVARRIELENQKLLDEHARLGGAPNTAPRYESLRDMPIELRQNLVKDVDDFVQKQGGKNLEYVVLGRERDALVDAEGMAARSVFGEMYGYAVPKPMYEAMTNVVNTRSNVMGDIARGIYYPLVKLKGLSQYSKTILSPITQVRNVTSAAMFALAQGNVGKNASLFESVDLVLRDLIDKELKLKGNGKITKGINDRFNFSLNDEVLDFLVDLQRRGVIGSSAQLREIQANLRQGLGYKGQGYTGIPVERAVGKSDEIGVSDFDMLGRSTQQAEQDAIKRQGGKLEFPDPTGLKGMSKTVLKGSMNMGRRFLDTAEGLYKGGDDIWKIYNYAFELQKIRNARASIIKNATNRADKISQLRNFERTVGKKKGENLEETLKRYAADTVRNTVPNYELVPEFIKGLRGVPLGNFIAFPAEILRTGFNTLDVAAKELSNPSFAIREIGMKRLMGGITAFGLVGTASQKFAQEMTDISDEELESANRLAAPWQRNSQLIPVGRDENGNFEFIDFSHTNPYDLLSRAYRTVLNSYKESNQQSKSFGEAVNNAFWDSLGEYFLPFLDQSMVFAAIQDALPLSWGGRGGRTRSGAKVYREEDAKPLQWEKSLVHMFNTLLPNAIPVRVPVGAELGVTGGNFPVGVKSIEKGRFLRGVFGQDGEIEPSSGKTYKQGAELFRAFTGVNTQTLDLKKLGEFRSQEFKQARSGAASIFNEVLRLENPDPEQIITAFKRADDSRLKTFREFAATVEDLQTLGLNLLEIQKIMKDAGLGKEEINSILLDSYIPFTPSKDKIKDAQNKGLYIPMGDIFSMKAMRRGMSLKTEKPLPFTEEGTGLFDTYPFSEEINTSAVNNQIGQQNLINNLQPSAQDFVSSMGQTLKVNPEVRTNLGFLGGSPEEALKNLDIARRTQ